MLLDLSPTDDFLIRVPRSEGPMIRELIMEHGFDLSIPASSPSEAVLFTREPYAAVQFFDHATPAAKDRLIRLHEAVEESWRAESKANIDYPADQELWPFQRAGVEYALSRKHTLIGDQPGLGKTPQAICLANEMRARRVLVICPANIRLQWAHMIRRWSTMNWPFTVHPALSGKHGIHPYAAWNIVSYDLARSPATWAALVGGKRYDLLVLDEAHYLKTVDARRTRAILGGGDNAPLPSIASHCEHILALTGTPLPNRPREAYTLARGLCFDAVDFMSEEAFTLRFNPSMRGVTTSGKVYNDERTGRHGELQARLRANFMVRREKHGERGVLGQLRLPKFDIVHVEETGAVKAALKAERLLDIDLAHLPGPESPVFGQIATVRRMMGEAIAPLGADYVEMLLEGGEDKLVVFAHHINVLNLLEARLTRFGLVRIDGSTGALRKQTKVDKFIADESIRVCLGNLQSMGTGTDGLQDVCAHAVFIEADWTPGVNQQGVDRLDRGGQAGTVQADFLVAPNSFSERLLSVSIEKEHTVHAVLDRRR